MANKEKDVIEVKGVILESLPNAMFLVELDTSHHRVTAHPSGKILLEVSPYDITRGRIIYRFK
jgi:translation initiation factor IF-1